FEEHHINSIISKLEELEIIEVNGNEKNFNNVNLIVRKHKDKRFNVNFDIKENFKNLILNLQGADFYNREIILSNCTLNTPDASFNNSKSSFFIKNNSKLNAEGSSFFFTDEGKLSVEEGGILNAGGSAIHGNVNVSGGMLNADGSDILENVTIENNGTVNANDSGISGEVTVSNGTLNADISEFYKNVILLDGIINAENSTFGNPCYVSTVTAVSVENNGILNADRSNFYGVVFNIKGSGILNAYKSFFIGNITVSSGKLNAENSTFGDPCYVSTVTAVSVENNGI
ncbi:MAG: hypothetical protein Q4B84_04735, partial [Clostridia bacterium]|nr:hypothetical protein [Clostridia bacterium]